MKYNFTLIVTLLLLHATNSYSQHSRSIEQFNTVSLSGSIVLKLIPAKENKVIINGLGEEYLPSLITEVQNNELQIYVKGKIKKNSQINLSLFYTNINRIKTEGTTSVIAKDTISTDNISFYTTSASNVDVNIAANKVFVKSDGASNVILSGTTNALKIHASGASHVNSQNLKSNTSFLDASGASNLKVFAKNKIEGDISGASNVSVYGKPQINNINVSGAANISGVSGKIPQVILQGDTSLVTTTQKGDTNKINVGATTILIINPSSTNKNDTSKTKKPKKVRKKHWAGIDFGINGLLNNNNSFNLSNGPLTPAKDITEFMELEYEKSWMVGLNILEGYIPFYKHHFGFVTGLGFEFNNYSLSNNVWLNSKAGIIVAEDSLNYNERYTYGIHDSSFTYNKNKFKTMYITAPFLLDINTSSNIKKTFHFAAGAIVGLNIGSYTKRVYNDGGKRIKDKNKGDLNVNPFKIALTSRFGVGKLNFFVTYNLTPLFENNKGPELYPVSCGITLIGF